MALWIYIVLIVPGAWAMLVLLSLDDDAKKARWYEYVGVYALMIVAFLGVCSALALVGQIWRSHH
jgi:Mn2+/Fe2+ NRAMP family transporter